MPGGDAIIVGFALGKCINTNPEVGRDPMSAIQQAIHNLSVNASWTASWPARWPWNPGGAVHAGPGRGVLVALRIRARGRATWAPSSRHARLRTPVDLPQRPVAGGYLRIGGRQLRHVQHLDGGPRSSRRGPAAGSPSTGNRAVNAATAPARPTPWPLGGQHPMPARHQHPLPGGVRLAFFSPRPITGRCATPGRPGREDWRAHDPSTCWGRWANPAGTMRN